ncbi:50S ribosomal protein L35 [[Brevibacterium] frigoritolerans]|uniref:Large ribosomal subunit protein bL35 n=1 Tax=Peribacillus frigoritolerans TaxID=450367 RepID=A0A941J7Y8_9BACI|nr:50S ribosomal protein L35 [Peribacillus frigoritolerans]
MPKMKTHRGSAKRFKRLDPANLSVLTLTKFHLFANKSTKQKRKLRKANLVSKGDFKRIRHMLDNIK